MIASAPSQLQGKPVERIQAVGFLITGITSFQIGAAIAKGLFPVFGATGVVGLRVGFAALVLVCVWRPWNASLTRSAVKALIPYGVSMGVMNLFFYIALYHLPLGVAVALEFTGPLGLALVGSRRPLDVLWAMMVLAGLLFLVWPSSAAIGSGNTNFSWVGVAAALISAFCWAVYIIAGTRLGGRVNAGHATTMGMIVAAIALFPFSITTLPTIYDNPIAGVLAFCVAVLSSAIPYVLDMMAMRRLSPKDLGILLSIDPVIAALSGMFLLHESLTISRWIGVAMIVGASLGNVMTGGRRKENSEDETADIAVG